MNRFHSVKSSAHNKVYSLFLQEELQVFIQNTLLQHFQTLYQQHQVTVVKKNYKVELYQPKIINLNTVLKLSYSSHYC
ncbi:unnamed protein product [Paramecium octaurelia]|uniref:Uncharacterized protein n=1 Tax=Paramecium octaurelia TaxID=43137 RepID=A0A8S1WX65_PAROT|nr:unnamed protein product [Paramecium octaurelia]